MKKDLPRVLIDARMVGEVPHGIARYVAGIAEGLRSLGELPYEPVFLVSTGVATGLFSPFRTVVSKVPFLHPLEGIGLHHVLFQERAALFHSTSFSSLPFAGFGAVCPWVQTVHDLNHLRFGGFLKRAYYGLILRPFFARASALLTVSDFSRNEIASWAGIPPNRIEVTWNPLFRPAESDPAFFMRAGLREGLYFACVSSAKPHKNIPFLLRAYSEYRSAAESQAVVPIPLALSLKKEELCALSEGRLPPGVLALGTLSDREVSAFREGARATLFPSLYEGFGLPPLEALLSRSPLLVSRIPPHEEGLSGVEGGFLRKLDPEDLQAWKAALLEWTRSAPPKPSQVVVEGLLRRFSSRALGESLDRVYRRVLGVE